MAKIIPKRIKRPDQKNLSFLLDRGIRLEEWQGPLPLDYLRTPPPDLGGNIGDYMASRFREGYTNATYTRSIYSPIYNKETGEIYGDPARVSRIRYYVEKTRTRLQIYRDHSKDDNLKLIKKYLKWWYDHSGTGGTDLYNQIQWQTLSFGPIFPKNLNEDLEYRTSKLTRRRHRTRSGNQTGLAPWIQLKRGESIVDRRATKTSS